MCGGGEGGEDGNLWGCAEGWRNIEGLRLSSEKRAQSPEQSVTLWGEKQIPFQKDLIASEN